MEARSLQERVSEYMDKNPTHKPKKVAKVFPEVKFTVLNTTIYRWRKKYKEAIEFEQITKQNRTKIKRFIKQNKQDILINIPQYVERVKCPHCPGLYANEIMKFVGFRGSIDKKGICHYGLDV